MSEWVLPEGWVETTLGLVAEYGKAEKATRDQVDDDTWVLELEDIEKSSSKILQRLTFSERRFKSTKNRFKKGDVLYGKLRPYLDKVVMAERDGVCTTEIVPIDARPHLDNRYLFYWLKSLDFLSYVNEVGYGVNMPRLGTKEGKVAPFVLAPQEEQKFIADKLDELLAQVNNLKARLDAIPAILKRFRQSVLAAAVSGRLTEEWRDENGISIADWESLSVGDVSTVATGKTPSRKETNYWKGGDVPWLTSGSTGSIYTDSADQFVTRLAVEDCSLKIFEPGTLILAMYGEGKTRGQVTELRLSATCNQACAAVIVDDTKVLRAFLKLRLLENYEETRKYAAGGAQPNLNLNKVRAIGIEVPPKREQNEIVRRVDQLLAFADQIEQQVANAQARINKLTQSILAKAFRGELTAEWRAENPELISGEHSAAALLERIKAEKAKQTPTKTRRGGRKATVTS